MCAPGLDRSRQTPWKVGHIQASENRSAGQRKWQYCNKVVVTSAEMGEPSAHTGAKVDTVRRQHMP